MNIGAIILAAGYSSRMNACKPLLPFGSSNALCRCVDLFSTAGIDEILVITGYRAPELERVLGASPCKTVWNPDFASGMFSSICAGVRALTAECDAFFLLPVDIPLVRPATIIFLQEQFAGSAVLFPCFEGERGHPPLIPSRYRETILSYTGPGGLRGLLKQFPGRDIPVWDGAVLRDMDTPCQYQELSRLYDRYTVGNRSEAQALARHFMPESGIGHGQAVAEIACLLGEALNRNGYQLDVDMLYNAGLLHDIAKGQKQHARAGAELLTNLGLTGLASSVLHHNECLVPEDEQLTERDIICLADKLVSGCRRVTITERFAKTFNRYGHDKKVYQIIKRRQDNVVQLQKLIERQTRQSLEEILDQEKQS